MSTNFEDKIVIFLERVSSPKQAGFTLVELVIIIVVLGILAVVAVPKFGDISESSKVVATRNEMQTLQLAIVGNPAAVAGGAYIDRGFEGDIGYAPSLLADLVAKPDSIALYNRLTRLGWNGPYVDSSNGEYLTDAWGTTYVYTPASRLIRSVGGSDTITVTF
ncbi:MAG: type II secretion system GspH family protein [candidate division Zixibacteria bacterium]|nr:type II secretion system GspH family protein [candidate division Zixibacteria bacterium]